LSHGHNHNDPRRNKKMETFIIAIIIIEILNAGGAVARNDGISFVLYIGMAIWGLCVIL